MEWSNLQNYSNLESEEFDFKDVSDIDIKEEILGDDMLKTEGVAAREDCMEVKLNLIEQKSVAEISTDNIPIQHNQLTQDKFYPTNANGLEPYKCLECDFSTIYKRNLKRHGLLHKSDEVETYVCNVTTCLFQTQRKSLLELHIQRKHDKSIVYKCTECEYQSTYKNHFNKHALRHKGIEQLAVYCCTDCSFKTCWKNSLTTHKWMTHKKLRKLYCAHCLYYTTKKSELVRHLRLKLLKKSEMIQCRKCSYLTIGRRDLDLHLLEAHKDIKTHKCPESDFCTTYGPFLMKHVVRHENISVVFECTDCQYKTRKKRDICRHQRVHNKGKPAEEDIIKFVKFVPKKKIDKRTNNKTAVKHSTSVGMEQVSIKVEDNDGATNVNENPTKEMISDEINSCNGENSTTGNLSSEDQSEHKQIIQSKVGNTKADKDSMFKCLQCDYTTIRKSNLKAHERLSHKRVGGVGTYLRAASKDVKMTT